MKIEYDTSKNYWKCYGETVGLLQRKKDLLKNSKKKVYNYFSSLLAYGCFTFLLFLSAGYIFAENTILLYLLYGILIMVVVLLFISFLLFYSGYQANRKNNHRGVLYIDENGIMDGGNGEIRYSIPWNKVVLVGILKYSVIFVLDSQISIILNIETKEQILVALERYQPTMFIINQSK